MNAFVVRHSACIYRWLNITVFALSLALIIYLSADAFRGVSFLADRGYMRFQLLVCCVFIADFFIELYMSSHRWRFFRRRLLFLILSVPYLNLFEHYGVTFSPDVVYFVRFIPLARGMLAMAIVVGYVSTNRLTNIFASYSAVLLAIVYFGSLVFFEREHGLNPGVNAYFDALWWACADTTTTGCSISPMTPAGKVTGAVLAIMGMVMFPLFTVVITSAVRQRISSRGEASQS